jgi:hypothetical protein
MRPGPLLSQKIEGLSLICLLFQTLFLVLTPASDFVIKNSRFVTREFISEGC